MDKPNVQDNSEQRNIYQLIAKIAKEVGPVGKLGKNQQQGWSFRKIDDVYNHASAVFAEHGVICVPRVISVERWETTTKNGGVMQNRLAEMEHDYIAPDGTMVTTRIFGEGNDSGDKATNKAIAYAHKYSIIQLLMMPTGESDPDAESHETGSQKGNSKKSGSGNKATDTRPISDAQGKRLWAILMNSSITEDQLKEKLKARLGITSTDAIQRKDYDGVIQWLEQNPKSS